MSPPASDLGSLEAKKLKEMREVAWNLESVNQDKMYGAAQTLSMYTVNRTLLPKGMTLLQVEDVFLRKLMVRTVGRNVYGEYIKEFFDSISSLPPAEVAQVLQSIREAFRENGSPVSLGEQKRWIKTLETLGREHQPGVLELMAALGSAGVRWTKKLIRDDIKSLNIGAIASIREFAEKPRKAIAGLLCEEAAEKKRDLLVYIAGVVDRQTIGLLKSFLSGPKWQERKEVASAIGRVGVTSSSGIVRAVLNDPDWRVKQALIESVVIGQSRFNSLQRILEIFVADSHKRVHGSARRLLLRLGNEPCLESALGAQREKLMKRFRDQLLKAASSNKDIDSSWLGVELPDKGVIPIIEAEDTTDVSQPQPVGIQDLEVIAHSDSETPSKPAGINLREALLRKMLESKESTVPPIIIDEPQTAPRPTAAPEEIDLNLSPPARFLALMDKLSANLGKSVPLAIMRVKSIEIEMSTEEFDKILEQLVKEGTVYMVDEETVRRVDVFAE
ncbi:MAG: HEAT repeat domain-containing protein [Candidatus Thorarchaeota archaeon]